jgi:ABC-type branched-subunit amino acid transport system substrate-binding protein
MNQTITDMWSRIAQDYTSQFLSFVPYSTATWSCAKHIVRTDMSYPQLLSQSLEWFEKNNFAGYYFIGDGSQSSVEALNIVRSKYRNTIPEIGFVQLTVGVNNTQGINQMINSINASQRQRVGIVSVFPGSDPTTDDIFRNLRRLSIRYRVFSTNIQETQLRRNMVGHFAVSSYFQSVILPENSVFSSAYHAKYGSGTITTDMVQSYNSVLFWARAAQKAKSVNPTRVRVNLYDETHSTPSGQITIRKSNQISGPYRIAQVVSAGTSLFYRPIVGLDDSVNLVQDPLLQVEGDLCYFGAVRKVEPDTTALRVATVAATVVMQLFLVACMVWVTYHRQKLVIRHSGLDFLLLNLLGAFINLGYVYFVYPYEMTPFLCQARNWPLHIGFFLIFGTLIHKCFTIFDATRKKAITSKTKKIHIFKMVGWFVGVIVITLIVKTAIERDLVYDSFKVLEEGVLYERHTVCATTTFDLGITFACFFICIVGCMLAIQIRNVQLPFNESFQMGIAVYTWAFTKIVLEVIKYFAPYDHELFFVMEAWGIFDLCR